MSTQSRNPEVLEKMIVDGVPSKPGQVCNEYEMRIARDGTWYHQGRPINRKALVKLFSTVLRRDDSGDYWLVTPVERGRIDVEDAPFVAVALQSEGSGQSRILTFRTNLDHMVTAGADHPIRIEEDPDTGEPAPYILVRDNLEALINRAVFYDLVDFADEETADSAMVMGIWSSGTYFPLGRVD